MEIKLINSLQHWFVKLDTTNEITLLSIVAATTLSYLTYRATWQAARAANSAVKTAEEAISIQKKFLELQHLDTEIAQKSFELQELEIRYSESDGAKFERMAAESLKKDALDKIRRMLSCFHMFIALKPKWDLLQEGRKFAHQYYKKEDFFQQISSSFSSLYTDFLRPQFGITQDEMSKFSSDEIISILKAWSSVQNFFENDKKMFIVVGHYVEFMEMETNDETMTWFLNKVEEGNQVAKELEQLLYPDRNSYLSTGA